VSGYEESTRNLELGSAGSRERAAYLNTVRTWAARMNNELRSTIKWHVRIIEPLRGDRWQGLKLQAVDPVTGTFLGDPFVVQITDQQAKRLDELYRQGAWNEALELQGVLIPAMRIDETREAADPFDPTPLVGPFVEFGYRVEVRTILPPKKE
jgi:hypothetical protein